MSVVEPGPGSFGEGKTRLETGRVTLLYNLRSRER
jgi:hypothetical protein